MTGLVELFAKTSRMDTNLAVTPVLKAEDSFGIAPPSVGFSQLGQTSQISELPLAPGEHPLHFCS